MLDKLREVTSRKFTNLCKRMKIPNFQKEVFMANAIEIIDRLEKRISDLEDKLDK